MIIIKTYVSFCSHSTVCVKYKNWVATLPREKRFFFFSQKQHVEFLFRTHLLQFCLLGFYITIEFAKTKKEGAQVQKIELKKRTQPPLMFFCLNIFTLLFVYLVTGLQMKNNFFLPLNKSPQPPFIFYVSVFCRNCSAMIWGMFSRRCPSCHTSPIPAWSFASFVRRLFRKFLEEPQIKFSKKTQQTRLIKDIEASLRAPFRDHSSTFAITQPQINIIAKRPPEQQLSISCTFSVNLCGMWYPHRRTTLIHRPFSNLLKTISARETIAKTSGVNSPIT